MEKETYTGLCVGGPLDGEERISRFPKGFLLCDKVNQRAWVYDWDGGEFLVRDAEGQALESDQEEYRNRFRAAEEDEYDILAWVPEEDDTEQALVDDDHEPLEAPDDQHEEYPAAWAGVGA